MNKYMLILFDNMEAFENSSPEEMQAEIQLHMNWIEDLGDHYDSGEPLHMKAKNIKGKEKVVSDGPFIEAKELVGGFYIINANTLDEATELAKGCPVLGHGGSIEVREIMDM
ncbi:MAG: YciI family protein [Balneolaceae bacterium]